MTQRDRLEGMFASDGYGGANRPRGHKRFAGTSSADCLRGFLDSWIRLHGSGLFNLRAVALFYNQSFDVSEGTCVAEGAKRYGAMAAGTGGQPPVHTHISAHHRLLDLKLGEVWAYRDLIWLYARRQLVATYKQTILGPLWLIINPLLTSVVYMVVFGNIAGLSTEGTPQILFYLIGNAGWALFATIITTSSDTFMGNAYLFGKVYFPRLTIPLANILVAMFQFLIQFVLSVIIGFYYMATSDFSFTFQTWLFIPVILVVESLMALGFGIIASSLTTRYRDLRVLVNFGVRLWMFITPVVYPMSQFGEGLLRTALQFNPMTAPMELLRWSLWGSTTIDPVSIVISLATTFVVLFCGIVLFNKVERTFMDTV